MSIIQYAYNTVTYLVFAVLLLEEEAHTSFVLLDVTCTE